MCLCAGQKGKQYARRIVGFVSVSVWLCICSCVPLSMCLCLRLRFYVFVSVSFYVCRAIGKTKCQACSVHKQTAGFETDALCGNGHCQQEAAGVQFQMENKNEKYTWIIWVQILMYRMEKRRSFTQTTNKRM